MDSRRHQYPTQPHQSASTTNPLSEERVQMPDSEPKFSFTELLEQCKWKCEDDETGRQIPSSFQDFPNQYPSHPPNFPNETRHHNVNYYHTSQLQAPQTIPHNYAFVYNPGTAFHGGLAELPANTGMWNRPYRPEAPSWFQWGYQLAPAGPDQCAGPSVTEQISSTEYYYGVNFEGPYYRNDASVPATVPNAPVNAVQPSLKVFTGPFPNEEKPPPVIAVNDKSALLLKPSPFPIHLMQRAIILGNKGTLDSEPRDSSGKPLTKQLEQASTKELTKNDLILQYTTAAGMQSTRGLMPMDAKFLFDLLKFKALHEYEANLRNTLAGNANDTTRVLNCGSKPLAFAQCLTELRTNISTFLVMINNKNEDKRTRLHVPTPPDNDPTVNRESFRLELRRLEAETWKQLERLERRFAKAPEASTGFSLEQELETYMLRIRQAGNGGVSLDTVQGESARVSDVNLMWNMDNCIEDLIAKDPPRSAKALRESLLLLVLSLHWKYTPLLYPASHPWILNSTSCFQVNHRPETVYANPKWGETERHGLQRDLCGGGPTTPDNSFLF
ncbi:hypothetical protein BJ508DRAFT_28229 [Ascobolus immersus RN42]|uniref:Uncharacterized protein n=1 Tax=Ascobolus immersus RN42 TaxID=1160509 RepID=A0A3N4HT52_ASCIM|nr:hypothetical protein BJ508DRAFT_28229 [Ascobolus immersus RN42]